MSTQFGATPAGRSPKEYFEQNISWFILPIRDLSTWRLKYLALWSPKETWSQPPGTPLLAVLLVRRIGGAILDDENDGQNLWRNIAQAHFGLRSAERVKAAKLPVPPHDERVVTKEDLDEIEFAFEYALALRRRQEG